MSKSSPLIRPIYYPKGNVDHRTPAEIAAINNEETVEANAQELRDRENRG